MALFLVAALPRLWGLGSFITWDEPLWMFRSARFLHALLTRNPVGTFQIGAPGVITMWSGAIGIATQRYLLGRDADAWARIIALPDLNLQDQAALRDLSRFLVSAKVPLALLGAGLVIALYLLLRQLTVHHNIALLAALLLAFDPFHLAHSRVLHTDGPETAFMVLSLLSLLIALRAADRKQTGASQRWMLASGGLAGVAMLAKAPGLTLVPIAGLLMAAHNLDRYRTVSKWLVATLGMTLLWGIAAGLGFVLAWPAMWVAPLGTLQRMLGLAGRFARTPHIDNFFLGQHVRNPGPLFYPLSLVVRTTPVVWLGLLGALPLLIRPRQGWPPVRPMLLYGLLYVAAMTVGAKKFERYLLPVYPILDVVAAAGWVWIAVQITKRRERIAARAAMLLAIGLQVGSTLPFHPYYLVYANPLLGGPRQAVQWLPAGWGEGMDKAAAYLNQQEDAQVVALWGIPGFASLFRGQALLLTEPHLALADHAIVYIGDVQFGSPLTDRFYGRQQPEHVIRLHQADYAWIYTQETPRSHERFMAEEVGVDDLVLLDAPLLVGRRYAGPATVLMLTSQDDEAHVATALTRLAADGNRRLWYLSTEAADETLHQAIRHQLDAHALRLGEPRSLPPGVTARHYLLPAGARFRPLLADHPSDVNFGNVVRLKAYGLSSEQVQFRQTIELLLEWEAISAPSRDYTAFVHLLDDAGHRWSQEDVQLTRPDGRPTSGWEAGVESATHHALIIPPGIPPDQYTLAVGLYDQDGSRLLGPDGGTMYPLASIRVISPAVLPEPQLLQPTRWMKWQLTTDLTLWGVTMPTAPLRPGDAFSLAVDWWAPMRPAIDYEVRLILENTNEPLSHWRLPLAPYPTSRWQAGEIVRAIYDLRLPADLPGGDYELRLNLAQAGEKQLLLSNPVSLGSIHTLSRTHNFTLPEGTQPVVNARFGEKISLVGYTTEALQIRPGEAFTVTLYWQASKTPARGYTVFTHLVGPDGQLWGQRDHVPADGEAPTTSWLPGEVIADLVHVAVSTDAPPGEYQLLVGLYDADGQRLPLPDGGTAYLVAKIGVEQQ